MEYKVGDKVRIRSWNSMANEFGFDDVGDIYIPDEIYFVRDMRRFCGTVHRIVCDNLDNIYSLNGAGTYNYSKSMFDQSFQNT